MYFFEAKISQVLCDKLNTWEIFNSILIFNGLTCNDSLN